MKILGFLKEIKKKRILKKKFFIKIKARKHDGIYFLKKNKIKKINFIELCKKIKKSFTKKNNSFSNLIDLAKNSIGDKDLGKLNKLIDKMIIGLENQKLDLNTYYLNSLFNTKTNGEELFDFCKIYNIKKMLDFIYENYHLIEYDIKEKENIEIKNEKEIEKK